MSCPEKLVDFITIRYLMIDQEFSALNGASKAVFTTSNYLYQLNDKSYENGGVRGTVMDFSLVKEVQFASVQKSMCAWGVELRAKNTLFGLCLELFGMDCVDVSSCCP